MSADELSILIVDRLPLINDMRVIVHPLKLGELKLKNGAIVEIKSLESGNTIYAPIQAASNDDYDESDIQDITNDFAPRYGFIQMSRTLRTNLQCYLGQKVQIKKVKISSPAECVVLAPIDDTLSTNQKDPNEQNSITGTYADILFQFDFQDLPLIKDEVIPIYTLNRIIEFKVVLAQPSGVVIIKNIDSIACRNTTVPRGNSPRFNAINYDDIGGLHLPIRKIRQIIELPLLQPKLYRYILKNCSVKANVKDLLIIAHSGCGKTLISEAIKNETPANYLKINCYDLLTKNVEQAIAFLLKSIDDAVSNQPAIIYFDDFDAVSCPEINESAQPDNRLSNALCSALKRMRAEKGVIVIASVRDDSRIKKDIKMKFDRKITIQLPTSNEKLSIIRSISTRHPIDLTSVLSSPTTSNELINGKTSGQIKMTVLRYISRSLADLASTIKKEKRRKRKKSDIDDEIDTLTFSINQLKKVNITKQLIECGISLENNSNTSDVDSLFEDISFDTPESYEPISNIEKSQKRNQDDFIEIDEKSPNQDELMFDPEYKCYFSTSPPIKPTKAKSKGESEISFIDLFGNEPLYNEGIADDFNSKGKNRYGQDDYSDEFNKNSKSKKGKKNDKGRKRYDYDYYDDYYDYYDDYYDYYNDYSDDYYEDDRKPTKGKSKTTKAKKCDDYPEKKSTSTKKAQPKKGNKAKFVDPFGNRDSNVSKMPSKKKTTKDDISDKKKKRDVNSSESDDEIESKPKYKNPFNSELDDEDTSTDSMNSQRGKKSFGKVERNNPFAEESKPKSKNKKIEERILDDEEEEIINEPKRKTKPQQRKSSRKHNPFDDVQLSDDDDESSSSKPKKKAKRVIQDEDEPQKNIKQKKIEKESEDSTDEEVVPKSKNKKKLNQGNVDDIPPKRKKTARVKDSSSEDEHPVQKRRIRNKNPFE